MRKNMKKSIPTFSKERCRHRFSQNFLVCLISLCLNFLVLPINAKQKIDQIQNNTAAKIDSQCTPGVVCSEKIIDPFDETNLYQSARPHISFYDWCYDIDNLTLVPCRYKIEMQAQEERCKGQPKTACGHNSALHNPNISKDPKIIGFLSISDYECQLSDPPSTFILESIDPIPVIKKWHYNFCAGEAMEKMKIKHTAFNFYLNYQFLSPPCEDPAWCTNSSSLNIGYQKFEELGASGMITRCGIVASPDCQNLLDCPYNQPAHPTVHWADPKFELSKQIIECLAPKWVSICSKRCPGYAVKLVISDMSLPGGGLLDIGDNWTSEPNGHIRHRHGTEADLAGWSVPCAFCGLSPADTYDERWNSKLNPLWHGRPPLGPSCNLTYPIPVIKGVKKEDYGHVCIKLGENLCQ